MRNFLDPSILDEVAGLTWEVNSHMPSGVLLRAYDYYDINATMFVGYSDAINKRFKFPVWCRVELGPSPDGRMPDGVLIRAFNAFDRYQRKIDYITGYAEDIRSLPQRSASPPIWVWDYTGISQQVQ